MPNYVNTETGEVHLVGVIKRPRHREAFTILFQDQLQLLLGGVGRDLTALQLRVLLHLLATAEYGNIIDAHVNEIARALKHERASVSKALNRLENLELIGRQRQAGGRPTRILLDPRLAFRGNVSQRAAMLSRGWPLTQDDDPAKDGGDQVAAAS